MNENAAKFMYFISETIIYTVCRERTSDVGEIFWMGGKGTQKGKDRALETVFLSSVSLHYHFPFLIILTKLNPFFQDTSDHVMPKPLKTCHHKNKNLILPIKHVDMSVHHKKVNKSDMT